MLETANIFRGSVHVAFYAIIRLSLTNQLDGDKHITDFFNKTRYQTMPRFKRRTVDAFNCVEFNPVAMVSATSKTKFQLNPSSTNYSSKPDALYVPPPLLSII